MLLWYCHLRQLLWMMSLNSTPFIATAIYQRIPMCSSGLWVIYKQPNKIFYELAFMCAVDVRLLARLLPISRNITLFFVCSMALEWRGSKDSNWIEWIITICPFISLLLSLNRAQRTDSRVIETVTLWLFFLQISAK